MNMRLTPVTLISKPDLIPVGKPVFDSDYDGEVKSALEHEPSVRVFPAGEPKPKPVNNVVALSLISSPCPQVNRWTVANPVCLATLDLSRYTASRGFDLLQCVLTHLRHRNPLTGG
jgi:hypothetical protein